MQLAWVTDPHLEWLSDESLDNFMDSLKKSNTEGIIVSGDISYSKRIKFHLSLLAELPMPVYFVLGNHDIYESSFAFVHDIVRNSVKHHKNLVWLSEAKAVKLTDTTSLIGHDGWADGRAGMGQKSGFLINDYRAISDFRGLSTGSVFGLMELNADIGSRRIRTQIERLKAKHVIVVTHAPPSVKSCKFQGGPTHPQYLPHFSNIGMGKALETAVNKTGTRVSVLCGHTHEECRLNINEKIAVWVGGANYGSPSYITIDADLGA